MIVSKKDRIREPLTNKSIVLDLDETLVHTNEDMNVLNQLNIYRDPNLLDLRNRSYIITLEDIGDNIPRGSGTSFQLWGMTRPGLRDFLIFCFHYFKNVCVWSAGQRKYVEAITQIIFKDIDKPHMIYANDKCEEGYGSLFKPLVKMVKQNPNMKMNGTFVIDDRDYTFAENKDNGILIPPFTPIFEIDNLRQDDQTLQKLMKWFLSPQVITCNDITKLDKSHIFDVEIPRINIPISPKIISRQYPGYPIEKILPLLAKSKMRYNQSPRSFVNRQSPQRSRHQGSPRNYYGNRMMMPTYYQLQHNNY